MSAPEPDPAARTPGGDATAPNGAVVRAQVATLRQDAQRRLDEGADGLYLARCLSDGFDAIVAGLAVEVPAGVAVLATGGYGRREMAPFADLDLLILGQGPELAAFADRLLYPLWDARIDAGHAVRTVDEALALPASDLTAATALLDARFLAGDEAVAQSFLAALGDRLSGPAASAFARRLREEQAARHGRFGETLFLLEPDLKSGPGGYRDLCVFRWIARARYGATSPAALAARGEISAARARALDDALEWMLRVRVAAQLFAGRRQDHLRFAVQEAIAPRFYPDVRVPDGEIRPAVAPAVEALMHAFQRHARLVRRETARMLRQASAPAEPPPDRPAWLPGELEADPTFVLRADMLDIGDASALERRPAEAVRLFRAATVLDVPVAPAAMDVVTDQLPNLAPRLCDDAEAGRELLGLLLDVRDKAVPSRLEEAQDLGLLAAVVPAWGPTAGRVQHDLYHVYTVDQHSLYAVARLKALARGDLAEAHGAVTAAFRAVARRPALFVGTWLHDVGKPLAGKEHPQRGADLLPAIATRLGLGADDAQRAAFLIREHLVMAMLCQRRDLSELATIARFAELCGDEENLRALYVLTFCDLSSVSPGNLTGWKEALLHELYERTLAYLRRGADLFGSERAALVALRRRRGARLAGLEPKAAATMALLAGLPDRYFADNSSTRIAAHLRLLTSRQGSAPVLDVRHRKRLGVTELCVIADDVRGLLAEITGVLLAHRIDIVDAAIYSRAADDPEATGQALDLFRVRDSQGRPITDGARWDKVRADLAAVLAGQTTVDALLAARQKQAGTPPGHRPEVLTEIRVDNEASRDFTVLDVITADRPGVLYAIARTLHAHGLDIHRSKVATEPSRVYDVFYLRDDASGGKLTDPRRIEALREALLAALPH